MEKEDLKLFKISADAAISEQEEIKFVEGGERYA